MIANLSAKTAVMQLLAIQDSFRGVLARRPRVGSGGLTRLQRLLLMSMARQGTLSMSAVTDLLEVGAATGSQFVRTLELRGLVARIRDEEDHRRRMVNITTKGRKVLDEAQEAQRERLERVLEQLSDVEREQLVALARHLAEVLSNDANGFSRLQGGSGF